MEALQSARTHWTQLTYHPCKQPVSSDAFYSQLWWQMLFIAHFSYVIMELHLSPYPYLPSKVIKNSLHFQPLSLWTNVILACNNCQPLTIQAYHWMYHWQRKNRKDAVVIKHFINAVATGSWCLLEWRALSRCCPGCDRVLYFAKICFRLNRLCIRAH